MRNQRLNFLLSLLFFLTLIASCGEEGKPKPGKPTIPEEEMIGKLHLKLGGSAGGESVSESYHLETKKGKIRLSSVNLEGINNEIKNPFNNGKDYKCTVKKNSDGSYKLVKVNPLD